jgi:glycerophosphoryl diester phosphodiesterase
VPEKSRRPAIFNLIMNPKMKFSQAVLSMFFFSLLFLGCSNQPHEDQMIIMEESPMNSEKSQVLIIAHRGARALAPENTIPAAVKAYELGADGWELDVAMSLDGELVVLHDDTLERTSNAADIYPNRKPWSVYEFTLAELQQLDFGSWFVEADPFEQISQGQISPSDATLYQGVQIPTLREALLYTQSNQWWVNVEIKDARGTFADALIVSEVVELVEALEMTDQVLISSFNHDYLRQVKALNPHIATGALSSRSVRDPLDLMRSLDAQAFHPSLKITSPDQVQLLVENGYDVNVWTVNEIADMEKLINMGVTGIITDFPQRLYPIVHP